MIKTQIEDGAGDGFRQKVFPDGSSLVSSRGVPPFGKPWPISPFSQSLASSTGATDMRVAGTLAAPIDFFISSSPDADRYITAISFLISDASAVLDEFGHIPALINGCLLLYNNQVRTSQIFLPLRSNLDFIRGAFGQPAFGSGQVAFQAVNGGVGSSEAYLPVFKFSDWMPDNGLKLDRGSNSRITLRVQDNTTGVDTFTAFVFGFDRFPDIIPVI